MCACTGFHLVWALNVLRFLTLNWWILFRWQARTQGTFFLIPVRAAKPTTTFLLTVLLFADPLEDGTDLRDHYYTNHGWFFTLGALLPSIDAIDMLLKRVDHFRALGPLYPIFLSVVLILMAIASRTRRKTYHAFYAVFFLVYLLAFISIDLRLLN